MGEARYEVPAGPANGVNRVFTLSMPYVPGSVAVFLNGQLKRADFEDGWTETAPTFGQVELREAPLAGDVVQVFYTSAEDLVVGSVELRPVIRLQGVLRAVAGIHGRLVTRSALRGELDAPVALTGRLAEVRPLRGALRTTTALRGRIRVAV